MEYLPPPFNFSLCDWKFRGKMVKGYERGGLSMKCIVNGRILMPDGVIDGKVLSFDRQIEAISNKPPEGAELIDARGCYVTPGLIDVHCHGFQGWDVSRASAAELEHMSAHVVRHGVTGWLPTTFSMPWSDLERSFEAAREAMRQTADADWRGARVLGCNAEGPFLNPGRPGAQFGQFFQRIDIRKVKRWSDVLRLITVAPEAEGALAFIQEATRKGIRISMGHSDATAEQAMAGIEAGATHVTHLFNAMPPLKHREPGLIGAALNDDRVYCELIADGIHVSPTLFPMLAKLKPHRLVLITDSVICAGQPDGIYELLGRKVFVSGDQCRLADGTIAGSLLTMDRAVRNFAQYAGIPLWRVVNMASLYPARAIGVDDRKGALQRGKDADIVIADRDFNVQATYVGGKCCFRA